MHPWLADWIRPLVLLHVLAAFLFVALHGPSIAAIVLLRRERELPKVQALLDMSRKASQHSWWGWTLLALTGVLLASIEHAWRQPWVWGSAVLLVAVTLSMSGLAARAFNEARHAAGLPWFDGKGTRPAQAPDHARLDAALDVIRARGALVMGIGVAGFAALVWLMVWRPG